MSVLRVIKALGLALLILANFGFEWLDDGGCYFITDVQSQIFLPWIESALALTLAVTALFLLRNAIPLPARRWIGGARAVSLVATLLSLFAIQSVLKAGVLHWASDLIAGIGMAQPAWMRLGAVSAVLLLGLLGVGVVLLARPRWARRVYGLLALLGYGLFVLALCRASAMMGADSLHGARVVAPRAVHGVTIPSRRVVWVVFDELDYGYALGTPQAQQRMPRLAALAAAGVSASNAMPPANSTLASLPSLLMGVAPHALHVHGPASLDLEDVNARRVDFNLANSVFAKLPAGAASSSLLGYYHPYCEVLAGVGSCSSAAVYGASHWYSPILFQLPGFVIFRVLGNRYDVWSDVTREQLVQRDAVVGRTQDQLSFLHLNVPHVPGRFAQQRCGLPFSLDATQSYLDSLCVVDEITGRIVDQLRSSQVPEQSVLLVVTSDHWFRVVSPHQPQRIPFIAWIVGESAGVRVTSPFSSSNTQRLVLGFLNGELVDQAALARRMSDLPVFPVLMQGN
ncbi:MAG: sulfatase-like hydrolase/transferase [Proteobacteria bacterium]|nr:sulfatase-like hydrolase/transferase [Pseudomonadota bacterium]